MMLYSLELALPINNALYDSFKHTLSVKQVYFRNFNHLSLCLSLTYALLFLNASIFIFS